MRAVTRLRDKKTPVKELLTAEVAKNIRRGRREKQQRTQRKAAEIQASGKGL
jgi:hypothetical protein